MLADDKRIEAETRRKYSGAIYDPNTITALPVPSGGGYAHEHLRTRLELVRSLASGKRVLDLCCGSGVHLLALSQWFAEGVGLDFSLPFVKVAARAENGQIVRNVYFVCGSARAMPFSDASFELVYSFSALYHIPKVEEVVQEISRVLAPSGRCILDMGTRSSLNTLVCRAYPELAQECHVSLNEMREMIRASGLTIEQHRSFQIFPYWGDRPWWLRPLLSPSLNRLMSLKVQGKMIDEWVSSVPGVRGLAFRQLFVCGKR